MPKSGNLRHAIGTVGVADGDSIIFSPSFEAPKMRAKSPNGSNFPKYERLALDASAHFPLGAPAEAALSARADGI
jgi:hypothetical protein